eukprot:tig00000101_g4453.t2
MWDPGGGCAACVDAAQSFETLFRRALADGVKAVRVKYCDSETSTASMRAACQSASFGRCRRRPDRRPLALASVRVRSHESIIVCHHFRSALWLWARAPFRMRELDGTGTEFQSPRSSSFALGRGHVHARHEELEVPFEAELESDQPALDLVLRREELSVRYRAFRLERVLPLDLRAAAIWGLVIDSSCTPATSTSQRQQNSSSCCSL